MTKENRKYKDSVFCDLFYADQDAKANLLSLYNALHDTHYTDEKIIELVRLESVLFQGMKNDIAFLAGRHQIVLGEHQSTISGNMPLRSLMYIAREYERLIPPEGRYRSGRIEVPRPEFYTFYNGTEDYPAEATLKLSDAYPKVESVSANPEAVEAPQLELTVKVININRDKKNPLLRKCRVMEEYSRFVEETRKYRGDKNALEHAVRNCIREGILAEYLKRKSGKVINMLMDEYDYDMDIAVKQEEAREAAMKAGEKIGEARGMKAGEKRGILLAKQAMKLWGQGKNADEIAEILHISEEQVRLILS